MILLISPQNRQFYTHKLDEMFFARYRVFKQKLNWNLPCEDLRELDAFDHHHAYYLIYTGYKGEVIGGMRMIPTHHPHMTRDVFSSSVASPHTLPNTPCVFECSRFFIDQEAYQDYFTAPEESFFEHPLEPKKVMGELLIALMEFSLSFQLSSLITVSEIRVERMLKSLNWPLQRLGTPKECGNSIAIVGFLDVSIERLEKLRNKTNIFRPVLWSPAFTCDPYQKNRQYYNP